MNKIDEARLESKPTAYNFSMQRHPIEDKIEMLLEADDQTTYYSFDFKSSIVIANTILNILAQELAR